MEKWWNKHWVIMVLLLGLVMGVYANSLGNPFHYDDIKTISENVWIRSLSNSLKFFTSGNVASQESNPTGYRPFTLLSYSVNYSISGIEPWSYYLFQILIHAGSVLLTYWLVYRIHKNKSMAFLAAVLFGLHPANAEAVNYITARSFLLSGFFCLLAFSA